MRNVCSVEECENFVVGGGLCRTHYTRLRRKGSTDDQRKNARAACASEGCERLVAARGLCDRHYRAERRRTEPARKVTRAKIMQAPRLCARCGTTIAPERRRRGKVSYCDRACKDAERISSGKAAAATVRSYNTGLGKFKDNPELLRRAISYLTKTPATQRRSIDLTP